MPKGTKMSDRQTIELTNNQIAFMRTSLDYSAMRFRDYDYGPDLAEFGKKQRAREQAMIDSIRHALDAARPAG